jgi:hypothetical protein
MREFAFAVKNIDGNEDHAELDAGEIQIDHFDTIRQVNTQAVAGFQTAMGEELRQTITTAVDVAEGKGNTLEFERGLIAAAGE